jgi:hypothetical protein
MPYDDPDKRDFFLKRQLHYVTDKGMGFTASRKKAMADTEREYIPFWARDRIEPDEVIIDYMCPPKLQHRIRGGICVVCGSVASECLAREGE